MPAEGETMSGLQVVVVWSILLAICGTLWPEHGLLHLVIIANLATAVYNLIIAARNLWKQLDEKK